jgi:hypothetical protein
MTILRRSLIIGAAVSWTSHPTHARVRLGGGGQGPGIHTVTYGTPFKYNSGYSAKYGNGDVWATTWADNDELYTATDDFSGWQAVAPTSNMACNKLSSYATDGTMTGTTINSMTEFGAQLTTGSDGASYKAMGLVCIGGVLYMSAARQNYDGWTSGTLPYKQTSANLQIINRAITAPIGYRYRRQTSSTAYKLRDTDVQRYGQLDLLADPIRQELYRDHRHRQRRPVSLCVVEQWVLEQR